MRTIRTPGKRSFRLKSKKDLDTLFRSGKAFSVFPIKVYYLVSPASATDAGIFTGVGVSKKKFKRAVDRNTIKRRLRAQAFLPIQKLSQLLPHHQKLTLFFLFIGDESSTESTQLHKAIEKWSTFITPIIQPDE